MEVKDIRLLKINFNLNVDIDEDKRERADIDLKIKAAYEEELKEITVTLNAYTKGQDYFTLDVEYGGKFIVSEEEDDSETIDRLSGINCPAIIFPFLREYVADLTRRAGLEPFYFGPINFVKAKRQVENDG